MYILSFLLRLFPINRKKIVVCSYYGRAYCDSPKYIVEQLLKFDEKPLIFWALNNKNDESSLPKGVTPVRYGSFSYFFHLVTSKVWLDNCRKVIVPLKRKGQYYIQTWHGPLALKMVEKDAADTLTRIYNKKASIDSRNADYFVSSSKWTTELYRNAFCFNKDVIEEGTPRNDIFFDIKKCKEIDRKVRDAYKISKESRIVLYAPTFRQNMDISVYKYDYDSVIKEFEKRFNGNCVLLVRLHPNIAKESSALKLDGKKIIDATMYPDMQELLIASDILITDYSSSMFDFGIMGKACILYAPDIKMYLKERKMYFDIRKLPFPLSENEDELHSIIRKFDTEKYRKNLKSFYNDLGLNETGKSSEAVAKKIMDLCNES